jgi:hypothetical protein
LGVLLAAEVGLTSPAQAEAANVPDDLKAEEAIAKRLAERRVSVELKGAPLLKVIQTVGRLSEVSMIIDPRAKSGGKPLAEAKVTVEGNDMPAGQFLVRILEPLGLTYLIAEEMVFITDTGKVDAVMDPQLPEETRKKLFASRVNLEFEQTPLDKAIETVAKVNGYGVELGAINDAVRKTGMTCMCWEVSSLHLVDWLCRVNDLGWTVKDGKIVIIDRKAEK